jgi:HlyD family secretion protein
MKRRLIWAIILIVILTGVGYTLRPRPIAVEMGAPERRAVREFIAEDARTRLTDEYVIDMPVNGTVEHIEWNVGDVVEAGETLARVDTFDLEQQLQSLQAQVAQIRAQMVSVDVEKPKPEDLAASQKQIEEARESLSIAGKALSIAEINLQQAELAYERAQNLVREGIASQQDLDRARTAHEAAEQEVDRARLAQNASELNVEITQLSSKRLVGSVDDNEFMRDVYQAQITGLQARMNMLREDIDKTNIRAPVTGPILEKFVESRRVLAAGTPLLRQGDLASIDVESDILSEEVVRVKVGDQVDLLGKALGEVVIEGRVKRIYPSAFKKISSLGIEQQRVKVLIEFDNSSAELRPGTSLDAHIITAETESAIAVPERSIFRREGQWYLFAVDGNEAVLTPIEIGLKNDEWVEVVSGLDADERIILEPGNDLEPGSAVVPKE